MKYITIITIYTLFIFNISAKEIILDMLNKREDGQRMVYSQDVVKIDIGDTVKWIPKDGDTMLNLLLV